MRGAFLTLAFAALLVKILVPAGFMVADQPQARPFALVICSAQGRAVLPNDGDKAPAHKSKADSPCAFAANAAPPAPAAAAFIAAPTGLAAQASRVRVADLRPGLGLAAPPPPSQAPPPVLS